MNNRIKKIISILISAVFLAGDASFANHQQENELCALAPEPVFKNLPKGFSFLNVRHVCGGMGTTELTFNNGQRFAKGRVVLIDPGEVDLRLWYAPEAQAYDFSRNAQTEGLAEKLGKPYRSFSGKTVREFIGHVSSEDYLFAVNGHQGNFWTANTLLIINGEVVLKTAPAIRQKGHMPLTGAYNFFILDKGKIAVRTIHLVSDLPREDISDIRYAVSGPLLVSEGESVCGRVEKRPVESVLDGNHVTWDPSSDTFAFSAIGVNRDGKIIQLSMAGNPEKGEMYLSEIAQAMKDFGCISAILLGTSSDVQQYVKTEGDSAYLTAKARQGSDTRGAYPDGKPLGSIIYGVKKTLSFWVVTGDSGAIIDRAELPIRIEKKEYKTRDTLNVQADRRHQEVIYVVAGSVKVQVAGKEQVVNAQELISTFGDYTADVSAGTRIIRIMQKDEAGLTADLRSSAFMAKLGEEIRRQVKWERDENGNIQYIYLPGIVALDIFSVISDGSYKLGIGVKKPSPGIDRIHRYAKTKPESIIVASGQVRCFIYSEDGRKVSERLLNEGDMLLVSSPHGFEFIGNDTRIIVIPVGPFNPKDRKDYYNFAQAKEYAAKTLGDNYNEKKLERLWLLMGLKPEDAMSEERLNKVILNLMYPIYVPRKEQGESEAWYHRYTRWFHFATQHELVYPKLLDFKGKDVLDVLADGDFGLTAVYKGAKSFTAFDISRYAWWFTALKIAALKNLEYEEFKRFFLPEDAERAIPDRFTLADIPEVYQGVGSDSPQFNYDVYRQKVREELHKLCPEGAEFFDYVFGYYYIKNGKKYCAANLYVLNETYYRSAEKNNTTADYLRSEEQYAAYQRGLIAYPSDKLSADYCGKDSRILDEFVTQGKQFDIICLDNIPTYKNPAELADLFEKASRLLRPNGKLVFTVNSGVDSDELAGREERIGSIDIGKFDMSLEKHLNRAEVDALLDEIGIKERSHNSIFMYRKGLAVRDLKGAKAEDSDAVTQRSLRGNQLKQSLKGLLERLTPESLAGIFGVADIRAIPDDPVEVKKVLIKNMAEPLEEFFRALIAVEEETDSPHLMPMIEHYICFFTALIQLAKRELSYTEDPNQQHQLLRLCEGSSRARFINNANILHEFYNNEYIKWVTAILLHDIGKFRDPANHNLKSFKQIDEFGLFEVIDNWTRSMGANLLDEYTKNRIKLAVKYHTHLGLIGSGQWTVRIMAEILNDELLKSMTEGKSHTERIEIIRQVLNDIALITLLDVSAYTLRAVDEKGYENTPRKPGFLRTPVIDLYTEVVNSIITELNAGKDVTVILDTMAREMGLVKTAIGIALYDSNLSMHFSETGSLEQKYAFYIDKFMKAKDEAIKKGIVSEEDWHEILDFLTNQETMGWMDIFVALAWLDKGSNSIKMKNIDERTEVNSDVFKYLKFIVKLKGQFPEKIFKKIIVYGRPNEWFNRSPNQINMMNRLLDSIDRFSKLTQVDSENKYYLADTDGNRIGTGYVEIKGDDLVFVVEDTAAGSSSHIDVRIVNGETINIERVDVYLPEMGLILAFLNDAIREDLPKKSYEEGKSRLINCLIETGRAATDIVTLTEIAYWIGSLQEKIMTVQEKLDVLSRILTITPANLTYFKGERAGYVAIQMQPTVLALKAYQDSHPEIKELKVGEFGIGSGDTFLMVYLNAIAIGIKATYIGLDISATELDKAREKLHKFPNVKLIEQDLLTQDTTADIWGGEGTFDVINIPAVLHEVYSSAAIKKRGGDNYLDHERGKEAIRTVIRNVSRLLRPWGKLLIQDGFAPDNPDELVTIEVSGKIAEYIDRVISDFVIPFHKGRDPQLYKSEDNERIYTITQKELKFLTVIRYLLGIQTSMRDIVLSQEIGNQVHPFMSKLELYEVLKEFGIAIERFAAYIQAGDYNLFVREGNIRVLGDGSFPYSYLSTQAVKGVEIKSLDAIPLFDLGTMEGGVLLDYRKSILPSDSDAVTQRSLRGNQLKQSLKGLLERLTPENLAGIFSTSDIQAISDDPVEIKRVLDANFREALKKFFEALIAVDGKTESAHLGPMIDHYICHLTSFIQLAKGLQYTENPAYRHQLLRLCEGSNRERALANLSALRDIYGNDYYKWIAIILLHDIGKFRDPARHEFLGSLEIGEFGLFEIIDEWMRSMGKEPFSADTKDRILLVTRHHGHLGMIGVGNWTVNVILEVLKDKLLEGKSRGDLAKVLRDLLLFTSMDAASSAQKSFNDIGFLRTPLFELYLEIVNKIISMIEGEGNIEEAVHSYASDMALVRLAAGLSMYDNNQAQNVGLKGDARERFKFYIDKILEAKEEAVRQRVISAEDWDIIIKFLADTETIGWIDEAVRLAWFNEEKTSFKGMRNISEESRVNTCLFKYLKFIVILKQSELFQGKKFERIVVCAEPGGVWLNRVKNQEEVLNILLRNIDAFGKLIPGGKKDTYYLADSDGNRVGTSYIEIQGNNLVFVIEDKSVKGVVKEKGSREIAREIIAREDAGIPVPRGLRERLCRTYLRELDALLPQNMPDIETDGEAAMLIPPVSKTEEPKYNEDGEAQYFDGITTVVHIPEGHPLSRLFRNLIGGRASAREVLLQDGLPSINAWQDRILGRRIIATVREGSEHITMYDGLTRRNWRKKFDKQLNAETKNEIEERTRIILGGGLIIDPEEARMQAAFEIVTKRFIDGVGELNVTRAPRFRPYGISVYLDQRKSGSIGLLVVPESAEDLVILTRMQDMLEAKTGIRNRDNFLGHITLGYLINSLADAGEYKSLRRYIGELNDYIRRHRNDDGIVYQAGHIVASFFYDMESFPGIVSASWGDKTINVPFETIVNRIRQLQASGKEAHSGTAIIEIETAA